MTIKYGWYSNKMKEQNNYRRLDRKKKPISNIYLTTDDKEEKQQLFLVKMKITEVQILNHFLI